MAIPVPVGKPHPGTVWIAIDGIDPHKRASNLPTHSPIFANGGVSSAPHTPTSVNGGGVVLGVPSAPPMVHNPYVQLNPVPPSSGSGDTILKALSRCGKKLENTTRKAGDVAGGVWHHLKAGSSIADAAMAKLIQGTKVIAEGGPDKLFQHFFGTFPGEKFQKASACYLSTSSGPVIGTLYITTARIAFRSDNALLYPTSPGKNEWVYYQVVLQLNRIKAVNPSTNNQNPSDKYIQIVTVDGHEFWFMGFVYYDKTLKHLMEVFRNRGTHSITP